MKDDRPKVIVATIVFLVFGLATVTEAAVGFGGLQSAARGWLPFALFVLLIGVTAVVTLMNDPYPRRGVVYPNPRERTMAHVLQFTVGEHETHQVLCRWDQVFGWLTVTVDGVVVVKRLSLVNARLVTVMDLPVGEKETHVVRVVKQRPLAVSWARLQPLSAYIDGVLVASTAQAPAEAPTV